MKKLDDADVAQWLSQRDIGLGADRAATFRKPESASVRIVPPRDFTRLAFLSYYIALLTVPGEAEFAGLLQWQRAYSTEGTPLYRMAGAMWALGDRSSGLSTPEPGRLFGADECIDAASSVLVAFGFEWDAYVVPAAGDHMIYKHHDEVIDFTSPYDHVLHRIARTLGEAGWAPTLIRRS